MVFIILIAGQTVYYKTYVIHLHQYLIHIFRMRPVKAFLSFSYLQLRDINKIIMRQCVLCYHGVKGRRQS